MKKYLLGTILVLSVVAATLFMLPASASAATVTRWFGAYIPGAPVDTAPMAALESLVGTRTVVSNYFQGSSQGFTWTQAINASDRGTIPMATLEFWDPASGVSQPAYQLSAIANGNYDAYLRKYAQSAKSFGGTVWLRPFHEMNGNWYPWGGSVNGNSASSFIAAWTHVKDIFVAEGATNVQFVWCPNVDSVPNTTANAIAKYWPGDAYVDYIGLDGYNFGGTSWRSFSGVFGTAYATVTQLSATKPIIIAETACSTTGGDKAAWIKDMFTVIPTTFPRIVGVTWFNANKERDWRIESSTASLSAFVAGLASWNPKAVAEAVVTEPTSTPVAPVVPVTEPTVTPVAPVVPVTEPTDTPVAPVVPVAPVAPVVPVVPVAPVAPVAAPTSISIASSAARSAYGRTFVLSGTLIPGKALDPCDVEVRKPGSARWSYSSARLAYNANADWWYRYNPSMRGTYAFRVKFAGDTQRAACISRVISVSVI